MTDADQASYWQGVAERALAKQHEYEAQLVRVREALKPFAAIDTKGRDESETVQIAVCATRAEAERLNANIEEKGLPIKKAGTDPYAPDAGMNWPKLVLDIDGIPLAAFNRAREALRSTAPAEGRGDIMLASASCPQEPAKNEAAWLVELKGSRPEWAMVSTDWDEDWTTDSLKALRFARRTDADAYIEHYGWTEAFASEHMWTAPPVGSGRNLADATPNQPPTEAREDGAKVKELEARIAEACYANLRRRGMSSRPHANELAQAAMSVVAAEIDRIRSALTVPSSTAQTGDA